MRSVLARPSSRAHRTLTSTGPNPRGHAAPTNKEPNTPSWTLSAAVAAVVLLLPVAVAVSVNNADRLVRLADKHQSWAATVASLVVAAILLCNVVSEFAASPKPPEPADDYESGSRLADSIGDYRLDDYAYDFATARYVDSKIAQYTMRKHVPTLPSVGSQEER